MSIAEYFIFALFIFLGSFSIIAAGFNFDWYFQTSSAKTIVNWLGRMGARLFYVLLGITLIVCGIMGMVSGQG